MIDNEIRKQYRQVINDLKVAVIKTWAYRICEQAVEKVNLVDRFLRRILLRAMKIFCQAQQKE